MNPRQPLLRTQRAPFPPDRSAGAVNAYSPKPTHQVGFTPRAPVGSAFPRARRLRAPRARQLRVPARPSASRSRAPVGSAPRAPVGFAPRAPVGSAFPRACRPCAADFAPCVCHPCIPRACRGNLRRHRTNEVVGRRMDFSSDANANFEGLLEVNRGIFMPQMAEKTSPDAPPSCAVSP